MNSTASPTRTISWPLFLVLALTGLALRSRNEGQDVVTKADSRKPLRITATNPIAPSDSLGIVAGMLPGATASAGAAAGWCKYEGNPVLGGSLGTCFDVTLLQDNDAYRLWFSWRPKESVALVESRDGIHWSQPQIVLGPKPDSEWQGRINRPAVVKRDGAYHLWYTGQSVKRSWIGYATSPDGRT
jgi:hypothetical protein